MSDLSVAVVSITSTKRRRFFWAAWWTGAPARRPFRKPDASNGGATTREDALREAEKVAARSLTQVEPTWARAWIRVLRGMTAWATTHEPATTPPPRDAASVLAEDRGARSPWGILGVSPGASLAEIKVAYRKRALVVHPDHGGDAAGFRELHRAYERALARRENSSRKPPPRRR